MKLFYLYVVLCICVCIWGWWKKKAVLGKNDAEFIERITDESDSERALSLMLKSRSVGYFVSGVFIFLSFFAIIFRHDTLDVVFSLVLSVGSYAQAASDDAKIKMYYLAKNMMDTYEVKPC